MLVVFQMMSCSELNKALGTVLESGAGGLSQTEIGNGLKEALKLGVGAGSDRLSKVDGFLKSPYKILLPEDAQKVADKLKIVPGFNRVEAEIIKKINRGAEDAAKKAKPIFVNAIKQMTIRDAMNILMGEKNAATQFLERTTRTALYKEFHPSMVGSLNKFGALDYWDKAVTAYNKIPLSKKMNPRLDDYVTNKALDGLFSMVEKEERSIRKDKTKRVTDLLKKVFAKQD